MIKNIIIVVAIVVVLGIGIVGFLLYQPSENSYVDENEMKFTQQQADTFIAELDSIAHPILDKNWKWSDTEYNQAIKKIAEKDNTLNKIIVSDEISKTEFRRAENYSKKTKSKLEVAYNLAIIEKANELISSTDFDFELARDILTEIDSFNINYPNKEILQKYKNVSFRVYQAKELIIQNKLPTGEIIIINEKSEPITDFKEASRRLSVMIQYILSNNDFNFLTNDQKCHLREWTSFLTARQHKNNIEDIIKWVIKINPQDTKRAREIRAFINNGECTN